MALTKYPKFGVTGGYSQVTEDARIDQTDLVVSQYTAVFQRSMTKECTFTTSSCNWGINYDGDIMIDTVTLDIADEIDPNYSPNQPVNDDVSQTVLLIKLGCCKIIRGHVTLIIEGKGDYPNLFRMGEVGYPPFSITTAIGNFSIDGVISSICDAETVNSMYVGNYRVEEMENDWKKYHVEYKLTLNTASGDSVVKPLIDAENIAVDCPFDGDHCNSYKINYGLFSQGYARIIATVTKHPLVT
jgi:hypothetical protein